MSKDVISKVFIGVFLALLGGMVTLSIRMFEGQEKQIETWRIESSQHRKELENRLREVEIEVGIVRSERHRLSP